MFTLSTAIPCSQAMNMTIVRWKAAIRMIWDFTVSRRECYQYFEVYCINSKGIFFIPFIVFSKEIRYTKEKYLV